MPLGQAALASSLLKIPTCLRDDFFLQFLNDVETAEQFQHPNRVQTLNVISEMAETHVAKIESRHAAVRRITVIRSTQTNAAALEDVSGEWMFKQAHVSQQDVDPTWQDQAKQQKKVPKAAKVWRATAGGAWRVFVHLNSWGKKFDGPTASSLAAQYKLLSPEERCKFDEIGKCATKARQLGKRVFFNRIADKRPNHCRAIAGSDAGTLLPWCNPRESCRRFMHDINAKARAAWKACKTASKIMDANARALVSSYCKQSCGIRANPDLPAYSFAKVARSVNCLEAGHLAAQMSRKALKSVGAHDAATARDKFKALHNIIFHDKCPVITTKHSAPPCWMAGVCICSGRGLRLRKMKNNFKRVLDVLFPKRSAQRKSFDGSFIVARFRGDRVTDDIDYVQAAANGLLTAWGEVDELSGSVERWAHVTFVNYRPFWIEFAHLDLDDRLQSPGCLPLSVIRDMPFMGIESVWRFFNLFELDLHWCAAFQRQDNICPLQPRDIIWKIFWGAPAPR
jgi:hypothetical protein